VTSYDGLWWKTTMPGLFGGGLRELLDPTSRSGG